jgi:hypothetical protein
MVTLTVFWDVLTSLTCQEPARPASTSIEHDVPGNPGKNGDATRFPNHILLADVSRLGAARALLTTVWCEVAQ